MNSKHAAYIEKLNKNFHAFEKDLQKLNNKFVQSIKKDAILNFNKFEFPTAKTEDWKYLPVDVMLKNDYLPSSLFRDKIDLKLDDFEYFKNGKEIVFVNGKIQNTDSKNYFSSDVYFDTFLNALEDKLPLIEKNLAKYSKIDNGFNALNTAFSIDGFVINVPDNAIVEDLNIVFISYSENQNLLESIKNYIHVGDNSTLSMVINYCGSHGKEYINNIVNNIIVGKNSTVNVFEIDTEAKSSFHIGKTQFYVQSDSTVNHFRVNLDGKILRNDTNIILDGKNIVSNLYGVYVGNENQIIDNHTLVDHAKAECQSNEIYKGVMHDNAKAVFNGKIVVRKDSQRTNAYQQNKNLLLSDGAVVNAKPQLEIFADDVKCSHGATVGQLDNNSLFYLKSRGISKDLAIKILVKAFASDIIDYVKDENLQNYLSKKITEKI